MNQKEAAALNAKKIKAENSLQGMFAYNMTSVSRIIKTSPSNQLPAQVRTEEKAYKDFVGRVMRDDTKTAASKKLFAAKAANQALHRIAATNSNGMEEARGRVADLQSDVDNQMQPQGTTDILIRQQQAALVQNLQMTDVMDLIQSGDIETAKCLQLPLMKAKFKLSNPDTAKAITDLSERAILGDRYQGLETARAQVAAFERMDAGLAGVINNNEGIISGVEISIV